jgi:DNA polymerase-3 subunit epsilon
MPIFWIDTETTGLNPHENGVVQIAAIVEGGLSGEVVLSYKVKPFPQDIVEDAALAVSGATREDLSTYRDPVGVWKEIKQVLSKHVDPYSRDKSNKYILAGHNVDFDIRFMEQFARKCGDKYWWSWFSGRRLDTLRVAEFAQFAGMSFDSLKLPDLCRKFEIPHDPHQALSDIVATRELAHRFQQRFDYK